MASQTSRLNASPLETRSGIRLHLDLERDHGLGFLNDLRRASSRDLERLQGWGVRVVAAVDFDANGFWGHTLGTV